MTDADQSPMVFLQECVLLVRRWRVALDERLREGGMTAARLTVLYWIDALPPASSQRQIADAVGVEGPTLVRQLHAMEQQGLVERVPIAGDRRAKSIRLTDAGKQMLKTFYAVALELSEERHAKLERRRLPSAIRLARQAREALE